jgi:hypothetical protein
VYLGVFFGQLSDTESVNFRSCLYNTTKLAEVTSAAGYLSDFLALLNCPAIAALYKTYSLIAGEILKTCLFTQAGLQQDFNKNPMLQEL